MDRNALLIKEMIRYYANDPKRIQHFIKVHDLARIIGRLEHLGEEELDILETAAIVHDIGIKVSEEKYGSIRNWKGRLSHGPCWKPWSLRILSLTGYAIWSPIIIRTMKLTDPIIRFWWKPIS